MVGWLVRFRNDLWRKRQGYKVVKDVQGVKWPRFLASFPAMDLRLCKPTQWPTAGSLKSP